MNDPYFKARDTAHTYHYWADLLLAHPHYVSNNNKSDYLKGLIKEYRGQAIEVLAAIDILKIANGELK